MRSRPLRWSRDGLRRGTRRRRHVQACAAALTAIAADTGQAERCRRSRTRSARFALLEGEPEAAAEQFDRALELVADTGAPFERRRVAA